jgi:lipopolysaccharide export system protein LptC
LHHKYEEKAFIYKQYRIFTSSLKEYFKMRIALVGFFSLALFLNAKTQTAFIGSYKGYYNGDNMVLTLKSNGANTFTGEMTDSQQKYVVNASTNGNGIKGTAFEATLNLTFTFEGTLNGTQLPLNFTLNAGGQTVNLAINFTKNGVASAASATTIPPQYLKAKLPSDATHDPNLVGKWSKNEYNNSGYGDNAMSSSFSQCMVFLADGSMSDGGAKAGISGSNYSGSSEGGGQALPNFFWYNIGNQLYIIVSENGKPQTIHLGRYYIENGKLLITGTNGVKLFLTKQ